MEQKTLFGIKVKALTHRQVLEQIIKYIHSPSDFFHIVSLNPENLVVAQENKSFRETINKAQIKIIDGVGVVLAARMLGVKAGERYPGVNLMYELVKLANDQRLRVLLIGGRQKVALKLAECYSHEYPEASFKGVEGIRNIKSPSQDEEKAIFSIVTAYKPHFIFVAFGSPDQELWLARHKDQFNGIVCMGVGGAFDYEVGRVTRAPGIVQKFGFEWLFRLLIQPWRWRRQLRLFEFIWLVFKQKFTKSVPIHPQGG